MRLSKYVCFDIKMGTIFYSKRGYIYIDLLDQILQFTIRAKRKVTEKIRGILFAFACPQLLMLQFFG